MFNQFRTYLDRVFGSRGHITTTEWREIMRRHNIGVKKSDPDTRSSQEPSEKPDLQ
jgi:hypothetical protein